MRVPRIYTPQSLSEQTQIRLEAESARHLRLVLRQPTNATVTLFNGDGCEYTGRIIPLGRHEVAVEILSSKVCNTAPTLLITLIQGVSKGDRMDYTLKKAVELGVHRIVPVLVERTIARLDAERLTRRMAHWQGILINACEQSGRCCLPTLENAGDLERILARLPDASLKLILEKRANKLLPQLSRPEDEIILLVGPEGGLSDAEQALAESHGFTSIRLGPRTLRTETAPLAAIAAVQTLWGDFRE